MEGYSSISPEGAAKIRRVFEERFQPWQLSLQGIDLIRNEKGSIHQNGWTINYRFEKENGREFMEFFASHRMTNDTLQRIYASGEVEVIGYCQEFFVADDPQAERAYMEHNQTFYEEVRRKGLDTI